MNTNGRPLQVHIEHTRWERGLEQLNIKAVHRELKSVEQMTFQVQVYVQREQRELSSRGYFAQFTI